MVEPELVDAKSDADGIWRDSGGEALHVSASDLERHAYCPLSWHLARSGVRGDGRAVKQGALAHAEIHEQMASYEMARKTVVRELTVWSWWFGIIVALVIDAAAWYLIADKMPPRDVARYLAILATVWVAVMLLSTVLPWRKWLNWPTAEEAAVRKDGINTEDVENLFQSPGFIGGWVAGGRVEAAFGLGAILLILHAAALWSAKEMTHAGFILLAIAMVWTLLASWRLQRALIADNDLEAARHDAGIDKDTEIAYSDSSGADLLVDKKTGLRGRPDQIVIVDGEFIPMEQKTGRIPTHPHLSHKLQLLAYIHLVKVQTGHQPPFGVLRYGSDIHKIDWNGDHQDLLMKHLTEVQRLMAEGGAKRNHERPGKCRNCSRRRACTEALE
jgi:CRISPR-associated exonuclease Cas4